MSAPASKAAADGKTRIRRLTRVEYENTVRDLFDLAGVQLQVDMPPDGQVHGFDKNGDALDLSHVNLAKYLEAADRVLDMAIATRPRAPKPIKQRISLANPHGFVAHVLMHGDGVLLKDKKPDPEFPPAGEQSHLDQGAHERMGSYHNGASVGLFRPEDESFSPYFNEFVAIYPGRYKLTTSLWSFQWDKGQVLPSRGTEAVRLSIVQLVGDGRGGGHPSTVLGLRCPFDERTEARDGRLAQSSRDHRFQRRVTRSRGDTRARGRWASLAPASRATISMSRAASRGLAAGRPSPAVRRFAIAKFEAKDHPGIHPSLRSPDRQQSSWARISPIGRGHLDRDQRAPEDVDHLLAEFCRERFGEQSPQVRSSTSIAWPIDSRLALLRLASLR